MTTVRALGALAVAGFRERVRRPAYAVILLATVGLGYFAAPSTTSHWTIVNTGAYRGIYTTGYIAMVTALADALWLTVGGFYVVRAAISRDAHSGVGELLATTPLRTVNYLLGTFLSNLLVLTSMAGVLAATALVMQFARGESTSVDPVAWLLPFALFTVPVLAVTAAVAVLFETIPLLRDGLGNIAWFLVSMVVILAAQGSSAPLGGFGVGLFAHSLRADMAAQGITSSEFSLGLMYVDHSPRTFVWSGLDVPWSFVWSRLVLLLIAAVLTAVPALWFGRFDPARARPRLATPATVTPPLTPHSPPPTSPPGVRGNVSATSWVRAARPEPSPRPGGSFGRTLIGEWRILVRGLSRWWWLGVLVLAAGGLVVPIEAVTGPWLLMAWIWPVLVWSRLGAEQHEHGTNVLLDAYPARGRRLAAEWVAGMGLATLVGFVAVLRMTLVADWPGVAAWLGGAVFLSSLALALGTLSRGRRLFQVIYLPLWYAALNGIAALDVMGTVRVEGHPAGPSPLAVGGVAAGLLGVAGFVRLRTRR